MSSSTIEENDDITEVEVAEAYRWIQATGFPQYLQMYRDGLFPIDLTDLAADNIYLDQDSILALSRRLETLNRCSELKIELPPQKINDDSDDRDTRALSDKWKYERRNSRWVKNDPQHNLSDSFDSVPSDSENSPAPKLKPNKTVKESFSPRLRRAASLQVQSAKNLLRRVDILSRRSQRRKRNLSDIGAPVVVDPKNMDARLAQLNCRMIKSTDESEKGSASLDTSPGELEPWSDSDTSQSNHSPLFSPPVADRFDDCERVVSTAGFTVMNNRRSRGVNRCPGEMFMVPPDHVPGSFPKVLSNGYVETGQGCGVNYRTGSFNFGVDSVTSSPKDDRRRRFAENKRLEASNAANRRSVYDNVPDVDVTAPDRNPDRNPDANPSHNVSFNLDNLTQDLRSRMSGMNRLNVDTIKTTTTPTTSLSPQEQLDLVLSELFENIDRLDQAFNELSENAGNKSDGESLTDEAANRSMKDSTGDSCVGEELNHDSSSEDNLLLGDINSNCCPRDVSNSTKFTDGNDPHSDSSPNVGIFKPNIALGKTLDKDDKDNDDDDDLWLGHGGNEFGSRHERRTSSVSGRIEETYLHNGLHSTLQHGRRDSNDQRRAANATDCDRRIYERSDSGVGMSPSTNANDVRPVRIRWHSFQRSHRPSISSRHYPIDNLSVGQFLLLRKLALLKLTAIMEKFSAPSRSGWNWLLPRFMKRGKTPEYEGRAVFGVPLVVTLQRTCQPLPQCLLAFMRYLRKTARDCVGLFRKSGVRSRIQKLRADVEASPNIVDVESLGDDIQAYDIADLFKQYFRELPECLLTNKLSHTFININTDVPTSHRVEALQAAILLLPDENREVLQSLLLFLSDIAQDAGEHQMTPSNLAVCFAPSLFYVNSNKTPTPTASPKRPHKNLGLPDSRELVDQKAAHECLCLMISECKTLFTVSEETILKCRFSYMEQGDPVTLEELCHRNHDNQPGYMVYVESCIQGLLKESHDKFKGWVSAAGSTAGIEVGYKKVSDGHALRLWRCCVEVDASPADVLHRILHERHVWDVDIVEWRYIEKLQRQTDVFQYTVASMAPHPSRDYCILRSWRTDLPNGTCVVVATSIDHPDAEMIGGTRAVVLASRYLIEPITAQRSKVTHVVRVDTRGRGQDWYNRAYGHIAANQMGSLRASFKLQPVNKTMVKT